MTKNNTPVTLNEHVILSGGCEAPEVEGSINHVDASTTLSMTKQRDYAQHDKKTTPLLP